MDEHLGDLLLPALTPGADCDDGHGPVRMRRDGCKNDDERAFFDQTQEGFVGWVYVDAGHRSKFCVTSLQENTWNALYAGRSLHVPTQDIWSGEWDLLTKEPYSLTDTYTSAGLHPFSTRLWGRSQRARMLRHRLHPRGLYYLKDGISYIAERREAARRGYNSGAFSQWWWLRILALPCDQEARERRGQWRKR